MQVIAVSGPHQHMVIRCHDSRRVNCTTEIDLAQTDTIGPFNIVIEIALVGFCTWMYKRAMGNVFHDECVRGSFSMALDLLVDVVPMQRVERHGVAHRCS